MDKSNDKDLTPTRPFRVEKDKSLHRILEEMRYISFQGRNLGQAYDLWKQMLSEEIVIFMGLAGAMLAGGMREIVSFLIRERYVDCFVSTGANLFHDLYESLGGKHYVGHPNADDISLHNKGLDRIYDTYASDKKFLETDEYVIDFSRGLNRKDPMTTREFFNRLGEKLCDDARCDGVITTAFRSNIPIYCPAIGDSSFGIALSLDDETRHFPFDTVGDVRETAIISGHAEKSGVIYVGGGTPKNFIQQTEVTAPLLGITSSHGHDYAVQIITDSPQWGGLSGCTFEEAQSWGKIAYDARKVTLHCDATIALPLLAQSLASSCEELVRKRVKPSFGLSDELEIVNR
jgi:deoxyhypusine synthase